MIKVIVSDMDGTLLGDDHKIAPQTLDAVRRACDAGLRFMIATGRDFLGVIEEFVGMDITCDYIAASGAEVRNPAQQIVSQKKMDLDLCRKIYEMVHPYPLSVIFFSDEYEYQIGDPVELEEKSIIHMRPFFSGMTDEEIRESTLFRNAKKDTRTVHDFQALCDLQVPIYKIMLFSENTEILQQIQKDLEADRRLAVAFSFSFNLEITDIRAQKGPVLKEYIETLGYTMDEVMVFGDSMNDYSMLSMDFGATVAMGNAEPEIKATAKYITKSNEEFGVAYAIDELLKRQGNGKDRTAE